MLRLHDEHQLWTSPNTRFISLLQAFLGAVLHPDTVMHSITFNYRNISIIDLHWFTLIYIDWWITLMLTDLHQLLEPLICDMHDLAAPEICDKKKASLSPKYVADVMQVFGKDNCTAVSRMIPLQAFLSSIPWIFFVNIFQIFLETPWESWGCTWKAPETLAWHWYSQRPACQQPQIRADLEQYIVICLHFSIPTATILRITISPSTICRAIKPNYSTLLFLNCNLT